MASNTLNEALWGACLDGDHEKVKQLIHQGADIHFKGQGGKTPLGIAAYCDNAEVVKILLNHGADPNEIDEFNRSTIHWLAMHGGYSTAVALIDHGADINIQTKMTRSTPLTIACTTGKMDIVKLLVSRGASWNVTNTEGLTPIQIARKEGHPQIEEYLGGLDDAKKRLQKALSEGKVVQLEITRMSIHGAPGSGKTCLQHLLLNEPPPEPRESTGVVTPAVRASSDNVFKGDKCCITRVGEDEFIARLSRGLNESVGNSSVVPSTQTNSSESTRKWRRFLPHMRSQQSGATPKSEASSSFEPTAVSLSQSIRYEIVSHLSSESSSDEFYHVRWIYCIDSGGQAAFQDIAPAFLRCNSLNIMTLRLIDELRSCPNTEFVLAGRYFKVQETRQLTNIDMITGFARSLSSVVPTKCTSYCSYRPNLLVFGTFQDRAHECPESLEEKNRTLSSLLSKYKDICITTPLGELIHPVNTLISEGSGRESKSIELGQLITSSPCTTVKFDLPVKWFLFQLNISKVGQAIPYNILNRNKCFEVGRDLYMTPEDVEGALMHFDALGMLFYFPLVLPNIVFTHPEPLLSKVSKLISLSFLTTLGDLPTLHMSLLPNAFDKFKREGLFTNDLVKSLLDEQTEIFSPHDFINLLKYLLIIAEIPPSKSLAHSVVQYFMPCVLPWKQLADDQRQHFTKSLDPIILSWDKEPIPYGLFPALINVLTTRQVKPMFTIKKSDDIFQQRRNTICFECSSSGWLLLVDCTYYIEVYYTGVVKHCPDILKSIFEGIETAIERYHYQLSCLKELKQGFHCESCKDIDYVRNDDDIYLTCQGHDNLISSHRKCPWFTGAVDNSKREIHSSDSNNDNWIEAVDDTPLDYYNSSSDFYDVIVAVAGVTNWSELGLALKLKPPVMTEIEKTHRGDVVECRKAMIEKWMQSSPSRPTWRTLCCALCKELVNHKSLAIKIAAEHPMPQQSSATLTPMPNQLSHQMDPVHQSSASHHTLLQSSTSSTESNSHAPPTSVPTYSRPVEATSDTTSALSNTSQVYQQPDLATNVNTPYHVVPK